MPPDVGWVFRRGVPDHVGQWRRNLARSHVDPDKPVPLHAWIRLDADLAPKVAFRRLVRHIDARAGCIELPTVIDAAQAGFLISAEEETGAAMGTMVVNQAYCAG